MDKLELLSYDECREKVDVPLLVKQMHYVMNNSPFNQEKLQSTDISSAEFSMAGFAAVPFTTKEEIITEQENFPPYGRISILPDPFSLRRVHITSGSTGRPLYVILTANDLEATVEAGRRAFSCAGLEADDTVIHCLNYCLWAGGVTDHLSLEATGATVIPFGIGNSKNLIRTILSLRPTAISCTPSYLSRLEVLLKDELDMAPSDLRLKKAFLGGEGGLQNPLVRSGIENKWNIKAIDANYGMADVLSIFGAECGARKGLHYHGQGILYLELIDPSSGNSLPIRNGQTGEMTLTNLRREAQPVVRYRTRDIIKIVSTEPCDCGRKSLRYVVVGRTDEMIVIRGINVYPSAVSNILALFPEWFSGEFEILLETPPPFERPRIRVELSGREAAKDFREAHDQLSRRCKEDLQFSARFEFIPFGEFPRTEGKTKRVKKLF